RTRNGKHIHERERIRHQELERVAAGRSLRLAVSALVVAEHTEAGRKLARLLVPHRKVGRQRVREDQPGSGGTVDVVVDRDAVGGDVHGRIDPVLSGKSSGRESARADSIVRTCSYLRRKSMPHYSGSPAIRSAPPRACASAGAQFTPANWRL